ncbi:MAG: hypothetical protein PCFJNLEI_00919 [Verrucomicrobiae bacterium]|nr:hypothetical protein [Verrucomicrobiae bacterium]
MLGVLLKNLLVAGRGDGELPVIVGFDSGGEEWLWIWPGCGAAGKDDQNHP